MRSFLRAVGSLGLIYAMASCTPAATAANRTNAVNAYLNDFLPAMEAIESTAVSPSGNPTCTVPPVDNTFADASLVAANYFRKMVGLPVVTRDAAQSAIAQNVAHLMWANGMISHSPNATWGCFDPGEDMGAGLSNLAIGFNLSTVPGLIQPAASDGPRAVRNWMYDAGSTNVAVGHRAWILTTERNKFGFGSIVGEQGTYQPNPPNGPIYNQTISTSAMHVGTTLSARPTAPASVAWPPPGYVPDTVAFARWSFAVVADNAKVNMAGATVSVSHAGVSITAPIVYTYDATSSGTGQDDRIVFEPELATVSGITWAMQNASRFYSDVSGADVAIDVTINGITVDGVTKTYVYTVNLMDAASL